MEKFIALIQLFTLLKVEFRQISPNEIRVHIVYNEQYDSLDWLVVDYE